MYIGLTGSPRIGGVEYAGQGVVSGVAKDESLVETRRGARLVVVEERFRPEGEVVWEGLTETRARTLQRDIRQVCTLDLRTRADGDLASASTLAVEVLRTTDIEIATPLRPYHLTSGRPSVTVRFGWRSMQTYTLAELGIDAVGGFDLLSETDQYAELEPYGGATITPLPAETVTLWDGTVVDIELLDLGDDEVAEARITDLGGDIVEVATRTPTP